MAVAKSIAPMVRTHGRPGEGVEHVEVVEEGLLDVDRQGLHLAVPAAHGHPPLLVGQGRGVEQLGDPLPALRLDQQHRAAAGGQGEREGAGDRRLAGPALAGDDVQAHGGGRPDDGAGLTRISLGVPPAGRLAVAGPPPARAAPALPGLR